RRPGSQPRSQIWFCWLNLASNSAGSSPKVANQSPRPETSSLTVAKEKLRDWLCCFRFPCARSARAGAVQVPPPRDPAANRDRVSRQRLAAGHSGEFATSRRTRPHGGRFTRLQSKSF